MTTQNHTFGPARTLGPVCEYCEVPKFIEEMSEERQCFCKDCAETVELAERASKQAEGVAEFRYAARYWLAVRPINMTRLCDLADERFAADALIESAERARFLLGDRFKERAS